MPELDAVAWSRDTGSEDARVAGSTEAPPSPAGSSRCRPRIGAAWLYGLALLWSGLSPAADRASVAAPGESERTETQAADSGSDTPEVDVEGSIGDAVAKRGWSVKGDLRAEFAYEDQESREGIASDGSELVGRIRLASSWGLTRSLRAVVRVAGVCSSDDCDGDFVLESSIPTSTSIEKGDATIDELFLHRYRAQRFDVAFGRLQTKFVLEGGVFAKSLDRNDSNNVNVNWTDGIHATLRYRGGWTSHLVLQANRNRGTGNARRGLLDFADDDSHVSYFLSFESARPWGHVVQRAFDVSYLPKSLLKDGVPNGRIEDYWGLVGRLAARWPREGEGLGLLLGTEVGYAPETPTAAATELDGPGDVDGLAWNVVASLVDVRPGHSIGLNYGQTDAGWLLSPQYRENEGLSEVRYQWKKSSRLSVEVRARVRRDLERLTTATRKRDDFDVYARLTWQFQLKEP